MTATAAKLAKIEKKAEKKLEKKDDKKSKARAERGLSYKDVQILFLSDGLEKIEKFYKGGLISAASMRRAAKAFDGNKNGDTFRDFVQAHVSALDGKRGRRAPAEGDTISYKAQQVGENGLFIRLPVGMLVDEKGAKLAVSFEDGVIKVTAHDDNDDE